MNSIEHKQTTKRKRIGIYGGSFNPAHKAHLNISNMAISRLELDEIWWIVANQNPLKVKSKDNVEFKHRFNSAKEIAKANPKILISDFEKSHNTYKTIDTLELLFQEFTTYDFIWIMGGDNFHIFHKWSSWQEILRKIPIAVFERPNYLDIENAEIYNQIIAHKSDNADELFNGNLPKWIYITGDSIDISSTEIRNKNPEWWENKNNR